MASVTGQDRFFSGSIDAATPSHLLGEGSVARLINCRFTHGAITNAVGFDEISIKYALGDSKRLFASPVTYDDLFSIGDLQVLAPLPTPVGAYLVSAISGRLFLIDPSSGVARDITPLDAFLADKSQDNIMSFISDDGSASGIGGTLVLYNYPNRPLFVTYKGARVSNAALLEMPPARCGVTVGDRAFIISGDNVLIASDALGQYNGPLSFNETFTPSSGFFGDFFKIGTVLDSEYVTAVCRLPKFLGPSTEFFSHSLYVFTESHRYIIAATAAREVWQTPGYNFILYGGTSEGGSGPRAVTVVGSSIIYQDTIGRTKQISEDQTRDTSLQENYFDEPLGQYLSYDEHTFSFREWYKTLDHRYATVRESRNRIFSTVYPFYAPAIDRFGNEVQTISHQALAVASRNPGTILGPIAHPVWEGFYDWFQPCLMTTLKKDLYVFAKDKYGKNTLLRQNTSKRDTHKSVIFTRAYFADIDPADTNGHSRSLSQVQLFFRELGGVIPAKIYFLVNGEWVLGKECKITKKDFGFSLGMTKPSHSYGIPLRIELDHQGCLFELESVRVAGETYKGF